VSKTVIDIGRRRDPSLSAFGQSKSWMRFKRRITPYLFISPFFIGFALFWIYPISYALWLSFYEQAGLLSDKVFIGLENYAHLWLDGRFLRALFNTSYYASASVFIIVPLALFVALILDLDFVRYKHFFRLFFFTPMLTASVVTAIMFTLIFEKKYGLLNNVVLVPLGLPQLNWLLDPKLVMPAIILVGIWKWTGINALYFAAGLQNVSREAREAAKVDGANSLQIFWYITIPLLRPILLFVIVLAIIGSYQLFGEPYLLLGGGGPEDAGLFMTVYLYITGFRHMEFGYASAIGYIMVVIILTLSLLQFKLFGGFEKK